MLLVTPFLIGAPLLKKFCIRPCNTLGWKTDEISPFLGSMLKVSNSPPVETRVTSFLNIALDLTRGLSSLPPDTTNFIYKVCSAMSGFSVEWDIVQEIVQKFFKPNKAMGLDHISPRDLKLCESSVVQGLFEIWMKSRADCQFPISWKKFQVTAVFKKGNRLDVNS